MQMVTDELLLLRIKPVNNQVLSWIQVNGVEQYLYDLTDVKAKSQHYVVRVQLDCCHHASGHF
jgi:hypothetical protein